MVFSLTGQVALPMHPEGDHHPNLLIITKQAVLLKHPKDSQPPGRIYSVILFADGCILY